MLVLRYSCVLCFFFFKQKTAYEMRISDWSSDVCSSDLGGIVYSPAGGTHHGRPDRASGFCYFNDPALGILALLDRGFRRICYVDVDAHHGDGVQDAFAADGLVLTLSVHEAGRWPFTGAAEDRAGGFARNLPVPPGFNDSEMDFVRERARSEEHTYELQS